MSRSAADSTSHACMRACMHASVFLAIVGHREVHGHRIVACTLAEAMSCSYRLS